MFFLDSFLSLVRIDVRSGCVLEMKEITITDVEQDLRRLYQVKTECLLEPLFKFMEIIKQFPPNEYMLRHLEKHSAQVMVYVKSEIRFDLVVTLLISVYFKNSIFFKAQQTQPK